MAHHLAELIHSAEHDADPSQSQEIVEIILRIWSLRHHLPRPPLEDFDPVIAALERLGDPRPWAFSRLGLQPPKAEDGRVSALAAAALALDRTARHGVLRLLLLAAHEASVENEEWLAFAREIEPTLESDVGSALERIHAVILHAQGADDVDGEDGHGAEDERTRYDAHAKQLRATAALLNGIADKFSQPSSDD